MKNLYKFKINYYLQYGTSRGISYQNRSDDIKKLLTLINEAKYIENYGILYEDWSEREYYYDRFYADLNFFISPTLDFSELRNYSLPMILKGDRLNIFPNNILNIPLYRKHLSDLPYLPKFIHHFNEIRTGEIKYITYEYGNDVNVIGVKEKFIYDTIRIYIKENLNDDENTIIDNEIGKIIYNNSVLRNLTIESFKGTIKSISEALSYNDHLTDLDITTTSNTGINLAFELSESLKINKSIKRLCLTVNDLEILKLEKGLYENKSIEKLILNKNKFGNIGLLLLAHILTNNESITELEIMDTNLKKKSIDIRLFNSSITKYLYLQNLINKLKYNHFFKMNNKKIDTHLSKIKQFTIDKFEKYEDFFSYLSENKITIDYLKLLDTNNLGKYLINDLYKYRTILNKENFENILNIFLSTDIETPRYEKKKHEIYFDLENINQFYELNQLVFSLLNINQDNSISTSSTSNLLESMNITESNKINFLENKDVQQYLDSILALENNRELISFNGFKALGNVLTNNNTLTYLNLGNTNMGYEEISFLANGLINNTSLLFLNIEKNNIIRIPPELAQNRHITDLKISDCNINNEGIIPFAEELVNNTSLLTLDITRNNITIIPSQFALNTNLEFFNIEDNPIEYLPPNVELRFYGDVNRAENINQDAQNIHDRSIQQSTLDSYNRIINATPGIPSEDELITIITNHEIMELIDKFENDNDYCTGLKDFLILKSNCKIKHSTLLISFAEALWYVFERIKINENKEEIIKSLCQDIIKDKNTDKCFTGNITRIINCLNVLDPLVNINLQSQNEIINNIVSNVYKNIESEYKEYENSSTTSSKEIPDIKTFFINKVEEKLEQNGIKVDKKIRETHIDPILEYSF